MEKVYYMTCREPKIKKGVFTLAPTAAINPGCHLDTTGDITIEPYAELAEGVHIYTHKHHWNHTRGRRFEVENIEAVDLVIEEDAFIGDGAIILSIERIGRGAIIGAGSVVTKNVPAYEIWAGNPAKKIGERKDDNTGIQ